MPGPTCTAEEQIIPNAIDDGVIRLSNVSTPTLTLYPAKTVNETAPPLVIVCPGGGYEILSMNSEGSECAEWLNWIGISAAVLKYRVPDNRAGALLDACQAVKLASEQATNWNIDPARIGMLGFSAGAHLCALCAASENRPAFSVLIYPAYLFKPGGIELVDELTIDANTPPAFVVQTKDDLDYYRSTLAYAAALDAAGVDIESHLFARGGHGYGLRDTGHPVSQWPELCAAWLREMQFIDG